MASVDLPYTVPNLFAIVGLSCGRDGTESVSPSDYAAPGEIKSVTLDVTGDLIVDHESELKRLMVQQ